MKVLRWIERIAHWVILLFAIGVIVAIAVVVSRPSEKSGTEPNFAGAEQKQKRLALFLDGTWNSVDSNTNVWRMRALAPRKARMASLSSSTTRSGSTGFWAVFSARGSMTTSAGLRVAYRKL
jgi:uncharacterized protein (DUF2235 family)